MGQFCAPVQDWDARPAQAAPPHAGDGSLHARVRVPVWPQAVAEQSLHSDQPPFTGVFPTHVRKGEPMQKRPPHAGAGTVQVRVCVPPTPQAVAEHSLHPDQPPGTGVFPVHSRVDAPAHDWPPHAGAGLVHVRVCVPVSPQAVAEHSLQPDQPPLMGVLPVHEREDTPTHALPPHPGDGMLHVRVCVPLAPQALAEQAPQGDQPPPMGSLPVQDRNDGPAQALPPQAGKGLLHVRVCEPLEPQEFAEQTLHPVQPPSTRVFAVHEREDGPEQV